MSAKPSNLQSYMANVRECAIGPYEPLSKAFAVTDGLANKLARALTQRNQDPAAAREQLAAAFATWPVLCRVMVELETAYPEEAAQGARKAEPLLAVLDRRDRTGDYA